jgi:hypothetical protein
MHQIIEWIGYEFNQVDDDIDDVFNILDISSWRQEKLL